MLKKIFIKILLPIFIFLISFNNVFATDLVDYIDPLGVSKEPATKGLNETLAGTTALVLNRIFGIIGLVALGIFIYSGIMYIASLGNAEKTKKAVSYMKYAVIGIVIIFFSYAIISFLFAQIIKLNV